MLLLPVHEPHSPGSEEHVVVSALNALASFAEVRFFEKAKLFKVCFDVAPLVCHPAFDIRQNDFHSFLILFAAPGCATLWPSSSSL